MESVSCRNGQNQKSVKPLQSPTLPAVPGDLDTHKRRLMHDIGCLILLARDFIADACEIRERLAKEIADTDAASRPKGGEL